LHPLQDHPYKATKWGGGEASYACLLLWLLLPQLLFFLLHIACYGNWGNEQQSNVEESIEKPSICARSSSTIPRIHMILTLHSQGRQQ
jgi:hypothetical protein